jgi:hypothetical protein
VGDEEELRKVIRPIEDFLSFLPRIEVLDTTVDAICHGAPLAFPGIARIEEGISSGTRVGIYTLKGELVAVAVTGPKTLTGLRRKPVNLRHLILLPHKVNIERESSDEEVLEALERQDLVEYMRRRAEVRRW